MGDDVGLPPCQDPAYQVALAERDAMTDERGWWWDVRGIPAGGGAEELIASIPEGDNPAGAMEAARQMARQQKESGDYTETKVERVRR